MFLSTYIEVSLPLHGSNSDILSQCIRLPALVTVSLKFIKIHRCRSSDGFLACSIDSISRTKIRPAVALRDAHQKMFLHAVLAHTGKDATSFQGITDRLAALSLVDHDLPLKSSESIKEVIVKRRAQNLRQLPDHTRFAGRLVLVDQCSPSLKSFSFFVGHDNFQRVLLAEENQCVIEVYCNTLQLGTSVNTTPQMNRFRGAKVCSKWLQEKMTITTYSLTTSTKVDSK